MSWAIVNSTLEDWSESYSGAKFHAVLCDPPYGLEFMGKEWDAPHKATSVPAAGNLGGFADGNKPSFARQKRHLHKLTHAYQRWGEAILPHLLPGAIVFMFGGTRTWHHLAMGMELAGFEMWDTLMWLYGQGFPKAQKVEVNGFDGHKTCALKPAWEPILAFRAPSKKTYAELAMEFGSGALNVEAARIAVSDVAYARNCSGDRGHADNRTRAMDFALTAGFASDVGRYPANLVIDRDAAVLLDEQSGNRDVSGSAKNGRASLAISESIFGGPRPQGLLHNDSGGASRFFYVAKADSSEREAGLREAVVSDGREVAADNPYQRGKTLRHNTHPTVKPIAVAKWLATLLLPPKSVFPRRLLIPFAGSGTEIIGAHQAGWDEILGIEQDTEQGYVAIAEARVKYWESLGVQEPLF